MATAATAPTKILNQQDKYLLLKSLDATLRIANGSLCQTGNRSAIFRSASRDVDGMMEALGKAHIGLERQPALQDQIKKVLCIIAGKCLNDNEIKWRIQAQAWQTRVIMFSSVDNQTLETLAWIRITQIVISRLSKLTAPTEVEWATAIPVDAANWSPRPYNVKITIWKFWKTQVKDMTVAGSRILQVPVIGNKDGGMSDLKGFMARVDTSRLLGPRTDTR